MGDLRYFSIEKSAATKRALRKSPDMGVCIDRQTESKKSIEGSRRV